MEASQVIKRNDSKELLIGCGESRQKKIILTGSEFNNLTTLDSNPDVKPDVLHDLNNVPWPFADDIFDEVHAYEVLEHLGVQGDYRSFFTHFEEIWRILKPNGILCASVPKWDSIWAWGDPGHTRIINEGSLVFLDQEKYGKPPMTDYRWCYQGNLKCLGIEKKEHSLFFVLKAIK